MTFFFSHLEGIIRLLEAVFLGVLLCIYVFSKAINISFALKNSNFSKNFFYFPSFNMP